MQHSGPTSNYTFILVSAIIGFLLALLIIYFIPADKNSVAEFPSHQVNSPEQIKIKSPKANFSVKKSTHAMTIEGISASHPPTVNSYAPAVNRAAPSVVNIFSRKRVKRKKLKLSNNSSIQNLLEQYVLPPNREEINLGSGVIVSSQGHILTNNHVIAGTEGIEVLLKDGRYLPATIVGRDLETDLALLKISATNLPIIYFGDSSALQVGDIVLAIGNPFGLGHTVTSGIISALNRSEFRANQFDNFIQTDAAINPGNSGGALVNTRGELIGINTINVSNSGGSQGIGFAIPASLAREVMYQLITYGQVKRGWIGIEAKEITPMLAKQLNSDTVGGLIIIGVLQGGPAQQAGIMPGDIITHINGNEIQSAKNAFQLITNMHPGNTAILHGIRKTQSLQYKVTATSRPQMSANE
jgi:Do/DeqQ family serine protease